MRSENKVMGAAAILGLCLTAGYAVAQAYQVSGRLAPAEAQRAVLATGEQR